MYTLMLQTHSEEKRVRVRQMWTRADSDWMNPRINPCFQFNSRFEERELFS